MSNLNLSNSDRIQPEPRFPLRTRVKICGITTPEEGRMVAELGADAIGLVFYPPSPRAISLDQADRICAALPPFVSRVALFVNPGEKQVREALSALPIDLLQFHGDESPEFCAQFTVPWYKAIRVGAPDDIEKGDQQYGGAKGLLLDTYKVGVPGGTGERFDWQWVPAPELRGERPILLAGGLTPENVDMAIASVQPYAVDVSGGVEVSPGRKDRTMVSEFLRAVYRADAKRRSLASAEHERREWR